MKKISTILFLADSQTQPSCQAIDIHEFLTDSKRELDQLFGGFELKPSANLLKRTFERVQNS